MSRKARLFQSTVARFDGRAWWLLNRPEQGWSSFGYRYEALDEIPERWAVTLGEPRTDELGLLVEVSPA